MTPWGRADCKIAVGPGPAAEKVAANWIAVGLAQTDQDLFLFSDL